MLQRQKLEKLVVDFFQFPEGLIEPAEGGVVSFLWCRWSGMFACHASIVVVVVNDFGGGGACNAVCTCVCRRVLELSNEIVPFLEEGGIECISVLDLGGVAVVVVDMVADGVGSGMVKLSGMYCT